MFKKLLFGRLINSKQVTTQLGVLVYLVQDLVVKIHQQNVVSMLQKNTYKIHMKRIGPKCDPCV